jgi:drug/metabolite transporter superfamily protein YnfA
MGEVVYVLCAATSMFCAFLLWRSYRRQRSRLLLLSVVCFLGLAINSILLFVDLAVLPTTTDLRPLRTIVAFGSILVFLFGLIWESH